MSRDGTDAALSLEPWHDDDLPLLQRLMGDVAMTVHLGGPESPQKIAERHARYVGDPCQLRIMEGDRAVGWVGYWPLHWRDESVLEMGWTVLPEAQGRGVARTAAALAIEQAKADGAHEHLHAFPVPANLASNGVCHRLGFTLLGECTFERPPGRFTICNDWRLALHER